MTPSHRSTPAGYRCARVLRKQQTPVERRLWARLRNHQLNGVGFRRQHAIGKYIVDFCAPKKKLIIELDGSQHLDTVSYDNERTHFLQRRGYQVLRFWNNEVISDLDAVLNEISLVIEPPPASPILIIKNGGE